MTKITISWKDSPDEIIKNPQLVKRSKHKYNLSDCAHCIYVLPFAWLEMVMREVEPKKVAKKIRKETEKNFYKIYEKYCDNEA